MPATCIPSTAYPARFLASVRIRIGPSRSLRGPESPAATGSASGWWPRLAGPAAVLLVACGIASTHTPASYAQTAPEITWNPRFYDPAGDADLVVPLPCGGAMAFQRVDTPVPVDDPIGDRTVQLGLGDTSAGYVNYLRRAHLRGGFSGSGGGTAHYFLGRYELTSDQLSALRGNCPAPSMRGAVPASGLSWFDAVDAARQMTEWLRTKAPGALPEEEGIAGFVRLPTETEWEYAVRGGAVVDVSVFNQRMFPVEGELRDYAWHQGARSARGALRPIGMLRPNPLGLHDVFGGVEELMLEPFRMNALGRPHGQAGGVVTRGGSILTTPAEFSSGLRQEFPSYGVKSGRPVALDTFGARFAIGVHLAVSTERTNTIRAAWLESFDAGREEVPGFGNDLTEALDALIEDEIERDRRIQLEAIRFLATEERRERQANRLRALKSSILGGAVLVWFLREDAERMRNSENAISTVEAAIQQISDSEAVDRTEKLERYQTYLTRLTEGLNQQRDRFALNFLSYERNLVTSATEYGAAERRSSLDVLLSELELSGRAALAPFAHEFYSDISEYDTNPDLPTEAIRRLALE